MNAMTTEPVIVRDRSLPWLMACDRYAEAREAEEACDPDADHIDDLVELRCQAEETMLRCPAPTLAAVLFKLEYGRQRWDDVSWPDDCWAALVADVRRFAGIPEVPSGKVPA